jgi:hypothetical protein
MFNLLATLKSNHTERQAGNGRFRTNPPQGNQLKSKKPSLFGDAMQGGWDSKFRDLFYALPADIQEQAKDKYIRWTRGDVPTTQWHKLWEWKKNDIWQLTIGGYRAWAVHQGGNRYNFYWIGTAQSAKKILTSSHQGLSSRFAAILPEQPERTVANDIWAA